jgi:glycosyltransferase involved in cell wall biosynthesis
MSQSVVCDSGDASAARPAGLLRSLVLFHEPDLLGAGASVLNVVEPLREYGWSVGGWIPGAGALAEVAAEQLAVVACAERPIAVSVRGWREDPGTAARLRATPRYLGELRDALLRLRPHVVHANTLRSLPEACVARSLGLPVVFHVHELPPCDLKRAATVRLAGLTADVLVGVSDAVSSMLRLYASGKPVLTARNGVGAGDVKNAGGERPFTVGTVGTICRVKGTDVFLRAASLALQRRPGLRFEHAGQGDLHRDAGLDDELASLLASPRLRNAAKMLGRRAAASVLPRWDLFVLPSRTDAFPLATLEAMAAGVPVVASRVGGIPEQITHLEQGVLVPAENAEALAEWIVRLHDDAALRAKLAAAASRRVREEFTLEKQAARLHRAYLLALNRRFGPPPVRSAARAA